MHFGAIFPTLLSFVGRTPTKTRLALNVAVKNIGFTAAPVSSFVGCVLALTILLSGVGHEHFTATQLKIIQEVTTLLVFGIFSIFYLRENLKWNHFVAFLLIVAAVFLAFRKWD